MSVAADLPSGRKPLPSRNSSASNLPGPHAARTFLTVSTSVPSRSATGLRLGDNPTIAPTLRSRLGQPSNRRPMPLVNESSTVEWQTAQVMPTDVRRLPSPETWPRTPTTALSLSSASVVAGSLRSTLPALIALTTDLGSLEDSTFSPTLSAVFGDTPPPTPPCLAPAIARLSWSTPVQKLSSPKVSWRKTCRPSSSIRCAARSTERAGVACCGLDSAATLNSAPPARSSAAAASPRRAILTTTVRRIRLSSISSTPGRFAHFDVLIYHRSIGIAARQEREERESEMEPRRRRARLVAALSAAVLLAAALVYTSFSASSEAREPSQLLHAAPGRSYQLTGIVLPGYRRAGDALLFRVGDRHGAGAVPIRYRGTVPDPFRVGREVIVTVSRQGGTFVGKRDSLVTKCPSKFTTTR